MATTNRHDGDKAAWVEVLGLLTERPGPDWVTANELAEKLSIPNRAAREKLLDAVKAGRAERKKCRAGTGHAYYYRIKQ